MYKLIIADDEPAIREGLHFRVNWDALGFQVEAVVEDGSDILPILEEKRIDVLLTDIRMYKISGLDVAKIIHEKYPWMKVVLISGYREFEYAKQAMHYGVYEYLLKPIDFEQLKELFSKIYKELLQISNEDELLHSMGESEYTQIVHLLHLVSDSILGDQQENWLIYARLGPLIDKIPEEFKRIVSQKVIARLTDALCLKDPSIGEAFQEKIKNIHLNDNSLSQILKELNDTLQLHSSLRSANDPDQCIKKSLVYIANHLNEDFTYRDVADFVGLSSRHFIRRFRSEMGETYTEYITRMRIRGAMKLIEEGTNSISELCLAVGYKDDKYFSQLFKKMVGCSVREYAAGRNK